MRHRILLVSVPPMMLAGIVMAASPALADSPHYLYATNSINTSTGALNTSFKEAGLGTGATSINETLTANASATYQCYNKAGNKPQGVPKSLGPTGVSASAAFPVRNGQTTGTLVAGPLGPGTFHCPSGQILFLDAVSYANTVVTDASGNFINATPDPISATVHIEIS